MELVTLPANWEAAIKDVMLALGFLQAKSNACLYFHEERKHSDRSAWR